VFEIWCVVDCHSENVLLNFPTFQFGDQALEKENTTISKVGSK
jgi:hypothetical protein